MKKITEITRRDIIDIIKNGFVISVVKSVSHPDYKNYCECEDTEVKMHYWGRLTETEFLLRLYDLNNKPSQDPRFKNAIDDIWQHTVNNDDWDYCWVFSDSRFDLSIGNDDEPLLKFMCEMLHPIVRKEDGLWQEYLNKFNQLLEPDGYVLYEESHISGRQVYAYRTIDSIEIKNPQQNIYTNMKSLGKGSYAEVYKFTDPFYKKDFALKRAKKDLNEKEILRFKREFDEMKKLNSPYILQVYDYNNMENEYIMELASCSLLDYIQKNNSTITLANRKNVILQILRGVDYLHNKEILHRDLSPRNVLLQLFEDVVVVKICDFGLVKIPESDLTSLDSDIKGSFNDPALKTIGFSNYKIEHEIYALTLLVTYVLTGKTNWDKIKDENIKIFMDIGTNPDISKRYKNIAELQANLPYVNMSTKSHKVKKTLTTEERIKLTEEIENKVLRITTDLVVDDFGQQTEYKNFYIENKLDSKITTLVLDDLANILNDNMFVKRINASLVLGKYVKVRDVYEINIDFFHELLSLYDKLKDSYLEYVGQFLFAVTTLINKNYSDEAMLPF